MQLYCLQKILNSWMFFGKTPTEETSTENLVTLKFLSTHKLLIYLKVLIYCYVFSQNSFHISMIAL